jgi:hypothetical protein
MVPRSISIPVSIGIAIGVLGATASAAPTDALEQALPPGWSLLVTSSELVIRHDRPCYVTGREHESAPATEVHAPAAGSGTMITVELRYKLEPRWTDAQLAAARATNDRLGAELRALAARYNLAAIRTSKGKPQPATADERARVEAYDAAAARVTAKLVRLPRCSLADTSVFDGPDTYAQLVLKLDPPEVLTQAHQILELMKQHCPS